MNCNCAKAHNYIWHKELPAQYNAYIMQVTGKRQFVVEVHCPDGELIRHEYGYKTLASAKSACYRVQKTMLQVFTKEELYHAARSLLKSPGRVASTTPSREVRLKVPVHLDDAMIERAQMNQMRKTEFYLSVLEKKMHSE